MQLNIPGIRPKIKPMNYIGSKLKLLPFIKQTVMDVTGGYEGAKFADLFAGTGVVSRAFKGDCRKISTNDLEYYSYVLNRHYIGTTREFEATGVIDHLNSIDGTEGKIYRHYCSGGGSGRQYFSDENGRKIDAIRMQINAWKKTNAISDDLFYFLLTSLLESADKVANVASVYGSYLKKLKPSARKTIALEPAIFEPGDCMGNIHQMDANKLVRFVSGDILYLDPPYNHRQYGANYHLLNTIAQYDNFQPKGKTGLRDYRRSRYCSKNDAIVALEDLIRNARFDYIFLSYNNEGIMSHLEIEGVMRKYGRYDVRSTNHPRFNSGSGDGSGSKETKEFIHILRK